MLAADGQSAMSPALVGREAAGVEVEAAQLVVEVDVEPLAAGRLAGLASAATATSCGPHAVRGRAGRLAVSVSRTNAWTAPSHGTFTKPTSSSPSARGHPAEAPALDLADPVVVEHAVVEALGVQAVRPRRW